MVRDTAGEVTFQVVPCSQVSQLEKTIIADYTEALKAYKEAKKTNPSEPAPKRPAVVELEKSVRGKDKADALATKWREKYEQRQSKKQEALESAKPTEEKAKDDAS